MQTLEQLEARLLNAICARIDAHEAGDRALELTWIERESDLLYELKQVAPEKYKDMLPTERLG